jgi:hypothetical protein
MTRQNKSPSTRKSGQIGHYLPDPLSALCVLCGESLESVNPGKNGNVLAPVGGAFGHRSAVGGGAQPLPP